MDKALKETKAKVKQYYEKVGKLNIDPFDIPESPDEIELYVGWFFDRIRSIVAVENSRRKFGDMKEVLVLLGALSDAQSRHGLVPEMEDPGRYVGHHHGDAVERAFVGKLFVCPR